jgi:superfamily II DNA or RNA helicase
MSFLEINLESTYESGLSGTDVISEFYIPVLENSYRYDRVAGYFSSRVFATAAKGVAGLVRNSGKMRLVTSHAFTPTDVGTFQDHFDIDNLTNALVREFVESFNLLGSLQDTIALNHVAAMCWMLREGYLEIKVVIPDSADLSALTPQDIDKFHPKFGIFYDNQGHTIAFSGSVNETEGAWKRNIENFDVYQSWIPGREDYINPKINQFEKYWSNGLTGKWKTIDLPDAVKNKIVQEYAPIDFPATLELDAELESRPLRNYQQDALESWINADMVGILEMATGTGKTRTAKACLEAALTRGSLLSIVVVPYQHIGEQWMKELNEFNPLYITGNWRQSFTEACLEVTMGRRDSLTIIVVKNTAGKAEFVNIVNETAQEFENVLLIGDEVHWLGATAFQPALLSKANFRLGLSATPRRYFDELGTDLLLKYFKQTVYELTLRQALDLRDENGNQILCPYEYNPIIVGLDTFEQDSYRDFTKRIMKLKGLEPSAEIEGQIQNLYIQRSNIAKSAASKIPAIRELLSKFGRRITQTLIYCADFNQLREVAIVLNELGIQAQQITGEEEANASKHFNLISEREHIINNFGKGNLDVLLAIQCLDEGVDIPSAQIGIILASSGNEKEFIQRRGRLMRPFEGKTKAEIYDFCVLPENPADPLADLGLVEVELRRIETFAEDAINSEEVKQLLAGIGRI